MPKLLLDRQHGHARERQVGRVCVPQPVRVDAPLQAGPLGQPGQEMSGVARVGWRPLEGAEEWSPLPDRLKLPALLEPPLDQWERIEVRECDVPV